MFKNSLIRKRVISFVEEKIRKAQEEYDTTVAQLETDHAKAVSELVAKLNTDKEETAEKLVQSIIGKLQ